MPIDDKVPELEEAFVLELVNASAADGVSPSTPTSGATIRPNFNKCNISIAANDNPYGVLQISASKPTGSGFILPLASPQNTSVQEEAGSITLFVNRAQGIQGIFLVVKVSDCRSCL